MNNIAPTDHKSDKIFPESKVMHIMRAFAIFCVICAHCAVINDHSLFWENSVYQVLSAFGIVGVPVFFFSSGYFFYNNQRKNYPAFLKHKIKTFFIPWIFTTTLVYLYVALRKEGLNIKDYIYFIIGIQNYTYFLSVLLIFFLCMLKVSYSKLFLSFCLALGVISLILTTTGVFNVIDPYCNPFNWLLYFIAGIIFKKHDLLGQFAAFLSRYIAIFFLSYIALTIAIIVFPLKINYWTPAGYLYIVITFMLVLGAVNKYHTHLSGCVPIGKESMAIYLIHSPFAGVLVYYINHYGLWYLLPLSPIVVLYTVLILIHFYKKISSRLNIENFSYTLIGISKK